MTASSWVSNLGSCYVQSPLEPEWSENTTLTSGSSANNLPGFLTPSPPQATPFGALGPGTTLVSGLVCQPPKGPLAGVSFSSLSPPLLSRLIPVVLRDWAQVASLPEASPDPPVCASTPGFCSRGPLCTHLSAAFIDSGSPLGLERQNCKGPTLQVLSAQRLAQALTF